MPDGGLKSSLVCDVACRWLMIQLGRGDTFATLAKMASSCLNRTEECHHQGRMFTFEMSISGRDPRIQDLGNQARRGNVQNLACL